ncbi:MAG TPA: FkbM family methyltransferase [Thermoanaerobaculia bacterium]|nr:FkbM family methyltransferase [Thermoanaerobaculia bacterium]
MRLLNRLPLTRIKIGIARLLYRGLPPGYRRQKRRIRRGGIHYEVDLSEGIDLSLFLFGGFQQHVTRTPFAVIPDDAVILDVGANAGVMALQFAKLAPRGHVYACEPTHYAFARLQTNLRLNPDLAARITAVQTFVSADSGDQPTAHIFASWKVDGTRSADQHPVHLGTPVSAAGVGAVTLDGLVASYGLSRVDLVKIDTDGHELSVLQGALRTLERFRPVVIFEVGLYVMEERGIGFAHYEEVFRPLGYRIVDSKTGREITAANHGRLIPARGTLDALALPGEARP